jgi:hypothetical protein
MKTTPKPPSPTCSNSGGLPVMVTYNTLSTQAGPFRAMTGLAVAEFGDLLEAFEAAYDRTYPPDRTAEGWPRQRWTSVIVSPTTIPESGGRPGYSPQQP